MISVVKFRPEHLLAITPQPEQREELTAAQHVGMAGDGWSVLNNGKPIACAVLLELGDGRVSVLAFIGADAGPHMRSVFSVANRIFDLTPHRRIEAIVLAGFAAGARWMRMLRFKLETPAGMEKFGPNGETYMLYSRVK